MSRKKAFLFISLVFVLALAHLVFAQNEPDDFQLADIFETIQGFDVAGTYEKFPYLVDTLIYFLFFISVAQVTLGKQFEGRGGKGVVIAVGLALSVAISFWARQTGFKLGNLGPLAALAFAIVIGIWIYRLLRGDRGVGAGLWISIVIIYIAMYMFFPDIVNAFQQNKFGRFGLALLSILFIIALPMSIISIFRGQGGDGGERGEFGGLLPHGGEGGGRWRLPWTHPRREPTTPRPDAHPPDDRRQRAIDEAEMRVERKLADDTLKLGNALPRARWSPSTLRANLEKYLKDNERGINQIIGLVKKEIALEKITDEHLKNVFGGRRPEREYIIRLLKEEWKGTIKIKDMFDKLEEYSKRLENRTQDLENGMIPSKEVEDVERQIRIIGHLAKLLIRINQEERNKLS